MSKPTLLLVDDTPTALKLITAIFEAEDYQILTATDGLDALEVLLQNRVDLVISDILMPNMDGYHLCYRIRTNPKLKSIPVIIYTATYVSLSEKKIALDMGANHYIRKPAPAHVLASAVKDVLASPDKYPGKIPNRPESAEMMQQYSAKLIAKLEQSNIELEEARKKIEQRENYFRALVENDYSITVLLNERFETVYRSPSSEAILGWTTEEQDKMEPHSITHPDDLEYQRFLMKKCIDNPGVAFPVTTRLKHKKGIYLWLEGITINRLADPNVKGIVTNLHDITERKWAEEKLVKAADRLREAQSIARMGNWEVDLANEESSWSDEIYAIYGYTKGEIPPTTESFLSFMHPADMAYATKQVDEAFSSLNNASFEYRFVRKDGVIRYGYTEWRFELDKAGDPVRLFGIIQDITEKKESEQKLAASEQRFRALIENSSDAIVLSGENFIIQYQSPSVTRILGYTLNDRKGMRPSDFVHPDDSQAVDSMYEEAASNPGKPTTFQYRFRHRHGHYIWLEGVVTNLLHDPNVKAYVANYRDVTARKEMEENLARTLRRFEQAQQIGHLGNWEVDFVNRKITWSDEAFRIYGLVPHEISPSEDLFLKYVHPDDLEMVKATTRRGQETLTPFSFYHRIIQPSGAVRYLFAVGRFELDGDGKPTALHGISLDVTELAEKEKKLEQANGELATFIYKAYHDLRSPIFSILGTVNLANNEVKDQLALRYFEMIGGIAHTQNKMLLSLIKVMSIRDRELDLALVEADELIAGAISSLKHVEGFEGTQFKVNNRVNMPVATDRELLSDVLVNLLENALLYREPARMAEINIVIDHRNEQDLLIEVTDNGMGIADDVKEKAFDLFFRGTHLSKGSGLGLYVVRNAVEKLGGEIELSSKVGVGTTFRIVMPMQVV